MRDIGKIQKALEEAQAIIHAYVEPGPRDATASMDRLVEILDEDALVAAQNRIAQDYGAFRVVK